MVVSQVVLIISYKEIYHTVSYAEQVETGPTHDASDRERTKKTEIFRWHLPVTLILEQVTLEYTQESTSKHATATRLQTR